MRISTYLVFTRHRVVRAVKHVPALKNGEYAVRLRIEAPDNLFAPETPIIDVTLPARDVIVPEVRVEPNDPPGGV